ncbi:hypothetical protein L9F63_004797 [Diploptera punctata]|uniref:Mitochondrial nucleoid factor 1 n=1 Tax=Diploptera punctata TaxID=6984 RepID=A0AAD8E721_DIPPU|nr:hypothetical protein L9F63_004797 [Diploptera punctata]
MANSYRNFLKLLEHWPVDTTKLGRDFGQHIREQVKVAFKGGELKIVDEAECNRIHASLKRLANNHYGQMFVRENKVSSTGLSAEECGAILSNEFLEELSTSERGFFSKYFSFKNRDK